MATSAIARISRTPADWTCLSNARPNPQPSRTCRGCDRYLINTNLIGTINCLGHARHHGAAVVYLSASRVYPIARQALRQLRPAPCIDVLFRRDSFRGGPRSASLSSHIQPARDVRQGREPMSFHEITSCGAVSNTRRSASTPMPVSPRPRPASAPGSAFIIGSASTRAWAIARRVRPTKRNARGYVDGRLRRPAAPSPAPHRHNRQPED
jgi:hypothetical protein